MIYGEILIIDPEDLREIGQMTEEERYARSVDMIKWMESLAEAWNFTRG